MIIATAVVVGIVLQSLNSHWKFQSDPEFSTYSQRLAHQFIQPDATLAIGGGHVRPVSRGCPASGIFDNRISEGTPELRFPAANRGSGEHGENAFF